MDDIEVEYCAQRKRDRSVVSDCFAESHSGGWYNTRRLYRSVAFGTWQVGGARQVLSMRLPSPGQQLVQTRSLNENRAYCIMNGEDEGIVDDGGEFGLKVLPAAEHRSAVLLHEQLIVDSMSRSMIEGASCLEIESFLRRKDPEQNLSGISTRNGSDAKPSQRAIRQPLVNEQRNQRDNNNKYDNNTNNSLNNRITINNNNSSKTIDCASQIALNRRRTDRRRLEWRSKSGVAQNCQTASLFDTNHIPNNNGTANNSNKYNSKYINTTTNINKSMQHSGVAGVHHRSRSAGCEALFSIISTHPSTSSAESSATGGNGCLSIRSNNPAADMTSFGGSSSGSSCGSGHSPLGGSFSAREPLQSGVAAGAAASSRNHVCLAKKFSLNCTRDSRSSVLMPQSQSGGGAVKATASSGTGLSAFKATKKFLKRIYHSATLPGRSHGLKSAAGVDSAQASSTDPAVEQQMEAGCAKDRAGSLVPSGHLGDAGRFFEIRYSSDFEDEAVNGLGDDDIDPIDADLIANELTQLSGCSLGRFPLNGDSMDHDSTTPSTLQSTTIDDPMNDSLLTKSISSNDSSQKTSSAEFHSWAEVFEHLKRELKCMRERDAQILADLQQVETQLNNVRNQSLGLEDHFSRPLHVRLPSEMPTSNSDYSLLASSRGQIKMMPGLESSVSPL